MGDGGYDHPSTYKALEEQQKKQKNAPLMALLLKSVVWIDLAYPLAF